MIHVYTCRLRIPIGTMYLVHMYTTLEDVIISTATEIIVKYRKKKQHWITDDILDLYDERRSLTSKKKPDLDSMYSKINTTMWKAMQEAKYNWIQIQCKSIDDDMIYGRYNKRAYNTLTILTKSSRRTTYIIEDSNGKALSENSSILNRWTEYCHKLYNYPIQPDDNILNNTDILSKVSDPDLTILKSAVSDAIQTLKEGKTPGIDNIPSELIKHGGSSKTKFPTQVFQKSRDNKILPTQWTQSLVIPILKKGDLTKCSNYRTLSLICHSSNILLKIILKRVTPQVEQFISEEQAGFRKGRSTVE